MSLLDNIRGIHTPEEIRSRADERYRAPYFEALPAPVSRYMRARAASIDRTDYRAANAYVHANATELLAAKAARAFNEGDIRDYAENYSRQAREMGTLEARAAFARRRGLTLNFAKNTTLEGRMRRLADAVWWRRQLRRAWTRRAENAMREIGMVRRMVAPYASDVAVENHGQRLRRQRDWIEAGEVVNADTGEVLSLAHCVDASIANPTIRRGELMLRARGFEEAAAASGHVAVFATLTTPSRYHAELMYGGKNPKHERETVREAQAWLCDKWAKARAKLRRLSVLYYGIRVAEPHHDGTPHWHLLMFVPAHQQGTVRAVLSGYWLSTDADDAGAAEHRIKFEQIEAAKGSATGYIAKYIAKNVDGAGQIGGAEDDETAARVVDGIRRVHAWASVHGIRQFQQIGGPSVGIWREVRRLREPVPDPDLERIRQAVDQGRYHAFIRCIGGVGAGRRTGLKIEREGDWRAPFQPAPPREKNYYGEPKRPRIVGVRYASARAITRPHRWRIQRCKSPSTGGSQSTECRGTSDRTINGSSHGAAGIASGVGVISGGSGSISVFSDLGPVAITVRGANSPEGWSNPRETSTAGPH